jgi:hypothetical protein
MYLLPDRLTSKEVLLILLLIFTLIYLIKKRLEYGKINNKKIKLTMESTGTNGIVASLHMHPTESGKPMISTEKMMLIKGKGIIGNVRYFDIKNKITGKQNYNHLSLIEREQIVEHAIEISYVSNRSFLEKIFFNSENFNEIMPGLIRSNIETTGINLMNLLDCKVMIGDTAVVRFYNPRIPCRQMDLIYPGLQKIMRNDKQGVLAEVVISGEIKVGDIIQCIDSTINNPIENNSDDDCISFIK